MKFESTNTVKPLAGSKSLIGITPEKIKSSIYFRYIDNFCQTYQQGLKKDFALNVDFVEFKGGKLIKSKIVKQKEPTISKIEKVESLEDALKLVKYNQINEVSKSPQEGTNIILQDDLIILIKSNSYSEWKKSKVNEDVNKIFYQTVKAESLNIS